MIRVALTSASVARAGSDRADAEARCAVRDPKDA